MKKKLTAALTAFLCAVLCCGIVFAENRVPEMEIDVALREDGSAHITQVWTTETDNGTEFYLARHDSGYLTISDFSVSDRNGAYTFVEDWDIDASFSEKVGKCGIVDTDKGVELCWGISEYGENRYTIEYVLHDLVGSYSDADGFNHRFVDEMTFFPTDLMLTIRNQDGTPLSDEICDIWAFGFDGQIVFDDGVIRAWTDSPLESGHHATVMVALDKDVLSPLRTVDDSFETVKERAFDGSDYDDYEDEPLTFGDILFTIVFFLVLGGIFVVFCVIVTKIRKAKIKKRMKKVDYFRDVPNGGNMNVSHQLGLCADLCEEDTLLGAYLLRLISEGCLESVEESVDCKNVCLRLCHPPRDGNEYDDALYTILEAAAGPDGVLQPMELEQFCSRTETPLIRFMDSCRQNGLQTLVRGGCMKGAILEKPKNLTQKGQNELNELLGLKKFLLDFSLIQERGVKETVIWQDYMVYALLLGIADKLEPQIRDLYPDQIPQIEQYRRYINYTGYYNTVMYSGYRREMERRRQEEIARTSGSGGSVSFGGGGGFSGGGGGGTR